MTVTSQPKREERKTRPVVIPYIRCFSEELKRTFCGFRVLMYFKSSNTLQQLLVHPKDPVRKDKVVGPVYTIRCEECEATNVDESKSSLKTRSVQYTYYNSLTELYMPERILFMFLPYVILRH